MTRNWSARICAMVVGCGLLLSLTPLFGQVAGTGAISGVVSDPSGAVIPGATVTARNLATGEERHTASSAHGDYNFQLLAPGRYQVMVSKEGFSTATVTGVTVSVTETTTANAKLSIGQAQQTVEVQAAGQLLQTESSTLGQVVTSQMVEDLPLVTRNYTQIIDLSPGV
ncbi:MAG: carboxypeptidase-like regulatory domain-containing protein, partial [Acidobacteriaceae bacterium]